MATNAGSRMGTLLVLLAGGTARCGAWLRKRFGLMDEHAIQRRLERGTEDQLAFFASAMPGVIFTCRHERDGRSRALYVSPGVVDLFGLSPKVAVDDLTPLYAMISAEDLKRIRHAFAASVHDSNAGKVEYRIAHPDKGERWIATYSRGRRLADGATLWHSFSYDVTERKQTEHERNRGFHTMVENSPDAIVRYDRDCRRTYANRAHAEASGIAADDCVGQTPSEMGIIGPEVAQRYQRCLERVIATGIAAEIDIDGAPASKERLYLSVRVVPEFDLDGSISGVLTICRDVTRRVFVENQLHEREQLFRTLIEHSPDFIARYNRQGEVVYANPAMLQRIIGTSGLRLAPASEAAVPAGQLDYMSCIRATLQAGAAREAEFQYDGADGSVRWAAVQFVPERGERGEVETVLAIGRDVTDIVHYREKVRQLAFFDSLTNLPNRAWLHERLPMALAYADISEHQLGLMMLDLDGFKEVNDVLGHACGDQLLREVSARLLRSKRGNDTVVRLGGDEFAIFSPVRDDVLDLAIIASKILLALSEPVSIEGKEVFISASIGISRYPRDGNDAATLLRYADSAMYAAKRLGGNQFAFHDPATAQAAVERMELGMALHGARQSGELVLLFQPIVGLPDAGLLGAEALLRWNHPKRGMLTPDTFIGVAEDNGTIVEIGDWVLVTACAAVVRWNAGRATPLRVSVNVSGRQFIMNDLARSVQGALAATGCAPQWLMLEITESLLLENDHHVSRTLEELSEMGVTIAIDDFGTGYSAISYLGNFPITALKIDRSFVRDIDSCRKKLALVRAMISMADALALDVVAEGVETQQQVEVLASLDCHKAQGYLFGRPMPEVEFIAYAHPDAAGASQPLHVEKAGSI